MKRIKEWFENDFENYDFTEYDGHLEARTKTVLFMVVAPHSGTDNKWMLRVTTISAFDRWANSTAVEKFFDTDVELCNYLYEHKLDIYMELIEYLSLEYDESMENFQPSKVEIIKDKYKYKFVTCPNCESELKVEKKSIKYHYEKGNMVSDVVCPCCNKKFIIYQ